MHQRRPSFWRAVAAIILLLTVVLVPHHHHEGGAACVAVELCHSDGVPNDEHTGHGEQQHLPANHLHYLRPLLVKVAPANDAGPLWMPAGWVPGLSVCVPRPAESLLAQARVTLVWSISACPDSRHCPRRGPPVC